MRLNQIAPVGPHIEGFIRFASEEQGVDVRQLDHFQVLSRSHEVQGEGKLPVLKQHPITEVIKAAQQAGKGDGKIRVIPIRLIADKPENSLSARYEAYDAEIGRLVCVGDGERCERAQPSQGITQETMCAGPEACQFANSPGNQCSLHVRLKVQIEGQDDPLSTFELQSGGINTYRTLAAKLQMMHGLFKSKLRGVPLDLAIYEKSSVVSAYQAFYVADLRVRSGMSAADALAAGCKERDAQEAAGLDYAGMEKAIEGMASNSPFGLTDAESSVITYSAGIVDRSELRRPAAREQMPSIGVLDIAGVVQAAKHNAVPVISDESSPQAKITGFDLTAPVTLTPEQEPAGDDVHAAEPTIGDEAPVYAL